MAAVLVNGSSLHAPDDYSQSVPQASSPASPSASFLMQQAQANLPSFHLNSSGHHSDSSQPTTPTSHVTNVPLDPPPGMSFPEYLRTWSDSHVATWLANINCAQQAPLFKSHDIRGDVLLELEHATLKEMGMSSVGDRIRTMAAVKALRQQCATHSSVGHHPRGLDHHRNGSIGSDLNGFSSPASRAGARRLDNGRPAPLHLTPGAGSDGLPRLIRDGQDSARQPPNPPIRPLPQPVANTPTIRPSLPQVPPVPRNQPPPPPQNGRPIPRAQLSGRRTPTLPDPPVFNTNQPLPPAPNANLLTPTSLHDARQGSNVARPLRAASPLHNSQLPNRSLTRSPGEHGRTGSISGLSSQKPPPRTVSANSHPYALQPGVSQQSALSPIAEAFNSSQRNPTGTPSPPTTNPPPFRLGGSPYPRPNTPSHTPSLDDINRKVVKFTQPDSGKSSKINVADCTSGASILIRALKKFRSIDDGPSHTPLIEVVDGGLCVDSWAAFNDWGSEGSQRIPLTEAQLISICHASPDEPYREHGITLRQIDRNKRGNYGALGSQLTFPRASGSTETLNDTLSSPEQFVPPLPGTKAYKRASSVSILSGLGVQISDTPAPSSSSTDFQDVSKSPSKKGKLHNFHGHRPPSELITNHLAEYFPFTEKKVLERTRRQSMFKSSSSKRASIISWNPSLLNQSRFSVSTQGSGSHGLGASPRNSIASRMSFASGLAEKQSPPMLPTTTSPSGSPPRVSISTEEERPPLPETSSETQAQKRASRRMSRPPHLLPLPSFSSESLAESLNLANSRPGSRTSVASKRASLITELRSKRDRSDTASLITVDEITAEVESRRESVDTDDWTAVDSDAQSIKEIPEDEYDEEYEEEEEEEGEDEMTEGVDTDDDQPAKAIMSHGEKTIKWIKGALIGSGSFGKVYLGMDMATGLLMAVKQVELPSGSAPNEERKRTMLSALEREIELLQDLHHENIVQYHSSCIDDDHLNIFLEYVPGGSVASLLRNYGAFEEPLVRNWVRQILLGLNYLHERDIIHRDIKGANMLVDNKGGIKISDFGISKKVEDNLMPGHRAHRPSLQGSVFWMAPEVVKQTAYTQKADIWSVGCLVVEMLTGEHPYPQLSQMQAIFKIGMSSKPTIPADISPEADSFLQLTFELDHELRPSAQELLKHPWIVNLGGPLMQ